MSSNIVFHVVCSSWFLLVPDECPSTGPIEECPTCCCKSSDNIEFYDPDSPEPECTASSALYELTYNFTWNEVCHPGNYESYLIVMPVWSAPIDNTNYRLWDACMDNVSVGIGLVSKFGLTGVVVQEFTAAGDDILEYAKAANYPQSTSTSSLKLAVDQDHQWVSAISARVSARDQLVGVADLRLCDGEEWKERVKVCFELFSTATASDRVAPEMMRNSVQGNSCSYGSIEFRFLEVLPLSIGTCIYGMDACITQCILKPPATINLSSTEPLYYVPYIMGHEHFSS